MFGVLKWYKAKSNQVNNDIRIFLWAPFGGFNTGYPTTYTIIGKINCSTKIIFYLIVFIILYWTIFCQENEGLAALSMRVAAKNQPKSAVYVMKLMRLEMQKK